MSDIAASAPIVRPPTVLLGPWAWARTNLFNSWLSTAVTLAIGYILIRLTVGVISWGLINAVWTVPVGVNGTADNTACYAVKGVGACWAVIADKYRFMLFGRYPFDHQWR